MHSIIYIFISLLVSSIIQANPTDLDTTFNQIGYANLIPTNSTSNYIDNVALQSDNKIVLCCGTTISGISGGLIARYNENGSIDTTFGSSNGYTFFPPSTVSGGTFCLFNHIALQADGKIVVTGFINGTASYFIARFTTSGILDTTFNSTGYFTSNFGVNGPLTCNLCIQTDGKIVVIGSAAGNLLIARHNIDGTLDTTNFNTTGTSGYIILTSTGSTYVNSIVYENGYAAGQQSTEKIIVVATSTISPSTQPQIVLLRLNTNGTPDTTFGPNGTGWLTTNLGYTTVTNGLVIGASDQITIAGTSTPTISATSQFFVAQYTSEGSPNASFNGNGYITSSFTGLSSTSINQLLLQTNGQFLAVGTTTIDNLGNLFTIRLNTDGTIDTDFASYGYYANNFNNNIIVTGAAIQSDGKFIFAGNPISSIEFITGRYLGGPLPQAATSTIEMYGQNSAFVSEFLYNDIYATIITDTTARSATIAAIDAILAAYGTDYANQTNFNYIAYLYLLQPDFDIAQAALLSTYPSSTTEINQFFVYLAERMVQLIAP